MKREIREAVLKIPVEDAPSVREDRTGLSVTVGILCGFVEDGRASIRPTDSAPDEPLWARSIVPLDQRHIGSEVVLAFDRDGGEGIILGVLQETLGVTPRSELSMNVGGNREQERVILTARQDLVLRCGQASVTLTRAGKILIRGAYLLSRSSGVNRIKGGSVQIN